MIKFRNIAQIFSVLTLLCMLAVASFAQVTTGNVRGVVSDPNGAVVPNAKVTLTQKSTNTTATIQSNGDGAFQFNNLLAGDDYSIKIEAASFKTLTLNDVKVQLNQTTTVAPQLIVGAIGEVVEVTAGGAELVDTSTQNLSKSFNERQVVDLAQSSTGLGVYNLALIAPNVSSSGGVGVGSGGSVGGQRARNNNFVVDGIDNIVTTQQKIAANYFGDGSVALACPPLKALLHIMHSGNYEGKTAADPEIRAMFTQESLLESDWYRARLEAQQTIDLRLWKRHLRTLRTFLDDPGQVSPAQRREVIARLQRASAHCERVERPEYLETLRGFIGADPSVL